MAINESAQYAQEVLRKNALERAQFKGQSTRQVNSVASSVKLPSLLLYIPWFLFAFFIDILDFVEALVGYGGGLTMVLGIIVAIIFCVFSFLASGKIRKMQKRSSIIQSHTASLSNRIQRYRTAYAKTLKTLRKTGAGRKIARSTSRAMSTLRKSPLGKSIAALVGNIIPFLDLLPWQMYAVYVIYKAHKRAYKDTQDSLVQYQQAQAEEEAEFQEAQMAVSEEIMQEAEEDENLKLAA